MTPARTFVIGDIHGCVDELNWLLDALSPTEADAIVFLGDYIDRGPASKAVIDRLLRLRREGPGCVFLKGNHEDMFLAFLGLQGHYGEAFLLNGGETTLQSYGWEDPTGGPPLPPEHLEFFQSLLLRFDQGSFLCVHAGLAPTRPLEDQQEEDLLWIREEFIHHPHPFPRTVLFGHTPHREVLIDLPFKVGLDTGLVYWNQLSCLQLEEKDLFQIRRGEHIVKRRSLLAQFEQSRRDPLLR